MEELFGSSRSVVRLRYALLAPSGFVPSALPGWQRAVCNVLISPAMGARFTQLLVTLETEGQCQGNTGRNEYVIYVVGGPASIILDERRHRLDTGSYVYVPPAKDMQIRSGGQGTRLLIFQKQYHGMGGVAAPAAIVGHERDTTAQRWLG